MKRLAADRFERHGGVLPGDRCCRTHRQRQVGRLPMREVHRRLQRQEPGVPVRIGDHVQPARAPCGSTVPATATCRRTTSVHRLRRVSTSRSSTRRRARRSGALPLTNVNVAGPVARRGQPGAILRLTTRSWPRRGTRPWKLDPDTGAIIASRRPRLRSTRVCAADRRRTWTVMTVVARRAGLRS